MFWWCWSLRVSWCLHSAFAHIAVKTNIKTVDSLDVPLELVNNTYRPYWKPNRETVYINKDSNHPPNVLKELPKAINKRITDILCNQDIFDAAKSTYGQALRKSGFNEELKYNNKDSEEHTTNKEKKKKRRNIICFNPPFSLSVKTDTGKLFFKMLKKNFSKSNPFSKIFNKNTIRISYSGTRNMKSIKSSNNKKILTPKNKQVGCNCRIKTSCPLGNKCQHRSLFLKLRSQTILKMSLSIIYDLQKQLLKNDIATTKFV